MLGKLLFLALTPFGIVATVISGADKNPILDYAGLVLAAAVVGFLCKYLCKITKQHREERKELVAELQGNSEELKKIIEKDIESRNRLAGALENRPCIAKQNIRE